jgi:polysaccharide export outer membrane protein
MPKRGKSSRGALLGLLVGTCLLGAGCQTCTPCSPLAESPVPRELAKVAQPPYAIESPDVLVINAVRVVPLPPYHVEPLDSVLIQANNVLLEDPIAGLYGVEPEGTVNLGFNYGTVRIAGLTLEEAQKAIEMQLTARFPKAQVRVLPGQARGGQQIAGEHLVRPDGTVGLGIYGGVYVQGLTLDEAKAAIEAHLAQYLLKPEVSVDVAAYNSKSYYIVTDGGGYGEQVYSFPLTGNETILDAMSKINGLPAVASKKRIWLARPAPADADCYQVLPIDWQAITRGGATATNYQLLAGDRIFVDAEALVTLDTYLARVFSPIERVFGITLLGSAVVHSVGIPVGGSGGASGTAGGAAGF